MKIEKILFPTRFREYAFNSLESLLVLKDAGLKEIILYHVIRREDVGFVPYGGYMKGEEERLREEAIIRFRDWQTLIAEKGIASKVVVEVSEPVSGILSLSEKEDVDLVVVGKKRGSVLEEAFLGTKAIQIMTRCAKPTLASKYVVEYDCDGECVLRTNRDKFKRPLFATDCTDASRPVLDLIISMKSMIDYATVCHVIGPRDEKGGPEVMETLEGECRDILQEYAGELRAAGIKTEQHLGAGRISDEIIRISREVNASLIIMRTTGKDRLHEFFQGSESHRVAQHSELPTLLVP